MLIPAQAATQGGCFTYPQAWLVGWTYGLLASAVGRGQLHRVRKGVWIERSLWEELDRRGQHVVEVRADLLILRKGWHAERRSAAIALHLPLLGPPPPVPQLVTEHNCHATSPYRHVAALPPGHTAVRDGIPLTSLSRTAVDLAREESFLSAVVAADAVLGLGVRRELLEGVLASMDRWPGVVRAREVLAFADGLSESALESLSRVRCHERALPPPELQVEVYRGSKLIGRVDKLWRAQRVVGEDDGMGKFGETDDERQESFRTTYRRGLDLEDTGLVVARWDWEAAWSNDGVLVEERVRKAFAKAQQSTLDPDIRFVPTTVEDRLRRQNRLAG
ncbi:MAG: hypothetical protein ABR549_19090 [Mycobacteriales bacterium]